MKSNRIMWGLTSLIVLITVAVSIGTIDSRSQEKSTDPFPTPTPADQFGDLRKYAVADYNAFLPESAADYEERKLKNKRYDNQEWVLRNPHPETGRVGRYDESVLPPSIPAAESDLIVTGNVVAVTAHLSNDKSGVYSEYSVKVDEILKGKASSGVETGGLITIDRAGGYVRYPSGQKVLYVNQGKELPSVGCEYLMFLRYDKLSKNYYILRLYELKESNVVPMDFGRSDDDIKGMKKFDFIKAIREKVSKPVVDDGSWSRP